MIAHFLYRNPRLLILVIAIIVVTGLSSYYVLPRMEDPVLGKRVAVINTAFPGADAEQVEFLVTDKLEGRLRDIAQVKEIQSISRAGISSVVIELRDEVTDVEPVWSRVRDRLSDAREDLPGEALPPDFRRLELKALAAIVAVTWNREGPPNLSVMRRLAEEFKARLERLSGTESVKVFGDPGEEVVVEIQPEVLATLGLSIGAVSQQIRESDARHPVGVLRGSGTDLQLDLDTEVDSLQRLGQTTIRYGKMGKTTHLTDIADINKRIIDPPSSMSLVDAAPAVVLGTLVRDDFRIDRWSRRMGAALEEFRKELPPGMDLDILFSQSFYVEQSLHKLLRNLLLGTAAVILVVLFLMGWRSTIVVGTALPLSALMVLAGMRALGIPIHQMSITGLIIALGLLIDNAIVIVDEIRSRIWSGTARGRAIVQGVRHLAMPLFGSTLTTTLAFTPIVLLPGPPGEFVGSIGVSVILAINASFLLAMTVVPTLTALLQRRTGRRTLVSYGLTSRMLTHLYDKSLAVVFRFPWIGLALGALLPILGYLQALRLPEQFFPPAERNQIHLEVELPTGASLVETRIAAEAVGRAVIQHGDVARLHWFLGESAPTFFYNVVPRRSGTAFYGQALVELEPGTEPCNVIRELQPLLDQRFGECRALVRQLEQGPPFDAPVEIRLRGPDLAVLQRLGSEVRLLLSQTKNVIHTRSDLEETLPKLALRVEPQEASLAGLSNIDIARQLYTALEGTIGGTLMEGSEELPIRVRLGNRSGMNIDQLAAIEMQVPSLPGPLVPPTPSTEGGPPLSALSKLELTSEVGAISRLNGRRMNEVKAYVTAGTLPSQALVEFQRRWEASDFRLPSGYTMDFGGESAKRDEAVGNLLADAVVLGALMLVTLVVSFRSFRMSSIIAAVGGLSIGLGLGALWCFGYPLGFMAVVGTMGLVGVAINDAIVVVAAIRSDPAARTGDLAAMRTVVLGCTRHVVTTSLTTMAGFTPLVLSGGGFWPPLAITIAGGIGGATLLALYFVPSLYLLLMCRGPFQTWRISGGEAE